MMKAIINFSFDMYVCLCKGVSDRTIRAQIEQGASTVEEIGACTGAGTKCGRCRPEIAEMLRAARLDSEAEGTCGRRFALAVVREPSQGESQGEEDETRAA